MIKAVFFDFAGVLGSSGYWSLVQERISDLESKRKIFEDFGNDADRGIIPHAIYISKLSKLLHMSEEDLWPTIFGRVKINKDLVRYIKKLKKHYIIGLLSNYKHEWLEEIIAKHDLQNLFDVIYISSRYGKIKPEVGAFRKALELAHVNSNSTVFVDDNKENVDAALKIGINAFVYTSMSQLKKDFKNIGIHYG